MSGLVDAYGKFAQRREAVGQAALDTIAAAAEAGEPVADLRQTGTSLLIGTDLQQGEVEQVAAQIAADNWAALMRHPLRDWKMLVASCVSSGIIVGGIHYSDRIAALERKLEVLERAGEQMAVDRRRVLADQLDESPDVVDETLAAWNLARNALRPDGGPTDDDQPTDGAGQPLPAEVARDLDEWIERSTAHQRRARAMAMSSEQRLAELERLGPVEPFIEDTTQRGRWAAALRGAQAIDDEQGRA